MRTLIILAALLPSLAAAQVLRMPNQAGGEIVLTLNDCVAGNENLAPLQRAYNYRPNGPLMEGCWYYKDGLVHVIWNSNGKGRQYVYQPDSFTYDSGAGK